MSRTILIDGREVTFRVSAASPRLYRRKFGRDLIRDFAELRRNYERVAKKTKEAKTDEEQADLEIEQLSVADLTVFENLAYIMAWQADPTIPDSPEEWLDQFSAFSIWEILPELIDMWMESNKTLAKSKNA